MRFLPIFGLVDGRKRQVIGHTTVDDEFFDYLNQWHWNRTAAGYVCRTYPVVCGRGGKRKMIYLHRLVSGVPVGMQVDHINRDPSDNRRENLRCSDNRLNKQNLASYKGSSSKYRGVSFDKERGKWFARVQLDGKGYHLGRFDDEYEAAVVASKWRKEHMPHTVEVLT